MRTLITWLKRLFPRNGRRPAPRIIKDGLDPQTFEAWISKYHQRLRHSRERNGHF
jgi:hypothetical protein